MNNRAMNERTNSNEVRAEGYIVNGCGHLRLRGTPSDPAIRELMRRLPTFILEDEQESEWQHSNLQVNVEQEHYLLVVLASGND